MPLLINTADFRSFFVHQKDDSCVEIVEASREPSFKQFLCYFGGKQELRWTRPGLAGILIFFQRRTEHQHHRIPLFKG